MKTSTRFNAEDKLETYDTSYPSEYPLPQARELLVSPYINEKDESYLIDIIKRILSDDPLDKITFDEMMNIQTLYTRMIEGKLKVKRVP